MVKSSKTSSVAQEDSVLKLTEAVEALAGEVRVLREILDRLQDDFAWALHNDAFRATLKAPVPPMVITSLPRDPLAKDFAARINRYRPEDLPPEEEVLESQEPEVPRRSGELF